MKLILFYFAKAFGGIIAAFSTFLVVFTPKEASCNPGYLVLTGILGLLGLYLFIRSDQKIKELGKADESAAKKIKKGIAWTALIIAIIFLLWQILNSVKYL